MAPSDPIENVYLYLLVRTDMASMNPGKAVAQGSHAATKATWAARRKGGEALALLEEWEAQSGQGVGVTATLGVDLATLKRKIAAAKRLGVHADLWTDDTYPLRDGETLHLIKVTTAGYVLGRRAEVGQLLSDLERMP